MRALDTSRAGRTTGGIACAPPAPCLHGLTHWPFDLGERPPTGIPGRNERLGGREPPPPPPLSAANVSLGLSSGQKPRRGSMSTATSRILATAHRATALSALRPKSRQPSGIPRRNERFSRQANAPSTIAMDVGPVADGHGTKEDNVGIAHASLPDANGSPAGQSNRLYVRFKGNQCEVE